jgi:chromosome segregation protein
MVRSGESVVGVAIDLLDFDPKFLPAFQTVLGGTVVMKTLTDARARMGQYRMVTLDGSLIEKSGSMTGGSLSQQGSANGFGTSFVDELHVLSERLSALVREEEMCGAAYAHAERERDNLLRKRATASEEVVLAKSVYEEYERRASQLSNEKDEIEIQFSEHSKEDESTSTELAHIEKENLQLTAEIEDLTGKIEALARFFDGDEFLELRKTLDQIHQQIDESKRRITVKETTITDEQREKTFAMRNLESLNTQVAESKTQIATLDKEADQLAETISECEDLISKALVKQREFTEKLSELTEQRDGILTTISDIDEKSRDFIRQMERLSDIIVGLEEKKCHIEAEIKEFVPEISDFTTDMQLQDVEQGIESAEYSLSRLGAVNMYAIEEFEIISERVEKRKQKIEVLSREHAEICERIEKYSLMKYDAFMQTYTAIANHFQEIFAKLAEGSGEIVLENQENPFLGGISFQVRPYHKNVHRLASLSGGEKSLITLAFIFSIQKHLPAPFYAFDEVDMNLDGNNVERIADMIRERCADSQFISISLRKPMIDASDRLIGVTTREDKSTLVTGVSLRS